MVKVKTLRPFPREEVIATLKGKKRSRLLTEISPQVPQVFGLRRSRVPCMNSLNMKDRLSMGTL